MAECSARRATAGRWSAAAAGALLLLLLPELLSGAILTGPFGDPSTAGITTDTDILEVLLKSYDARVRPKGNNITAGGMQGPVYVYVNMLIRTISKIDDFNMEYSTQITFREQWTDKRLAYGERELFKGTTANLPDFVVLPQTNSKNKQEIWMPDTFFQNEKQARRHDIDRPNVLIRIFSNGNVLYSVRLSLVLSCPMQLHMYPMDVQYCALDLASYAYTTDDIEYVWKEGKPIQIKPDVYESLPSFALADYNTSICTSTTSTGSYGCLRTSLTFARQFSYYLIQVYTPSTMLVIVSWVSFWLDRTAVPARVTLGVTTLLTMTTQASGINAKLPPVSYTKAIDVWINVCLGFIFGALLEFAYVTYVGEKDARRRKKMAEQGSGVGAADPFGRARGAQQQRPSRRGKPANAPVFHARLDDDYLITKSLIHGGDMQQGGMLLTQRNATGMQPQLDQSGQPQCECGPEVQQLQQLAAGYPMSGATQLPHLAGFGGQHTTQFGPMPGSGGGSGATTLRNPMAQQQNMPPQSLQQQQQQHMPPQMWLPGAQTPVFQQVEAPCNMFMQGDVERHGRNSVIETWKESTAWYMFPLRHFAKIRDRSRRADFLARIFFPFGFLMFNLIYWGLFTPGAINVSG